MVKDLRSQAVREACITIGKSNIFGIFLSYEKYHRDAVSTGMRSSISGPAPHTVDAVCKTLSALTIQITK
uniref:Uncharacterized protein n=1 Tax=Romanomermis culicivorax TaxID=13658 RepID=A0A915LEE5_ROMCU